MAQGSLLGKARYPPHDSFSFFAAEASLENLLAQLAEQIVGGAVPGVLKSKFFRIHPYHGHPGNRHLGNGTIPITQKHFNDASGDAAVIQSIRAAVPRLDMSCPTTGNANLGRELNPQMSRISLSGGLKQVGLDRYLEISNALSLSRQYIGPEGAPHVQQTYLGQSELCLVEIVSCVH